MLCCLNFQNHCMTHVHFLFLTHYVDMSSAHVCLHCIMYLPFPFPYRVQNRQNGRTFGSRCNCVRLDSPRIASNGKEIVRNDSDTPTSPLQSSLQITPIIQCPPNTSYVTKCSFLCVGHFSYSYGSNCQRGTPAQKCEKDRHASKTVELRE